MITTTQYIECYRKTDKNGNFYYTEKWEDLEYNSITGVFKHTTVVSGKCKKSDFEQRIQRSEFIDKSINHIIFKN